MNSKSLQNAAVTPDGIIPNTYYDVTPYVSAPSSPGRGDGAAPPPIGYFYSAPTSPTHHLLISSASANSSSLPAVNTSDRSSFEFDFGTSGQGDGHNTDDDDRSSTMSSADELFLNGQIRPMKLSSHLKRPQNLAPLIDVDDEDAEIELIRGRDLKKLRNKSLRRKARSLSPLKTDEWNHRDEDEKNQKIDESSKIDNSSTSTSKRWVFLKDFIRSKSDGSNNNSNSSSSSQASRLWSSISFSHRKTQIKTEKLQKAKMTKEDFSQTVGGSRVRNGIEVRKSAHEAHYTAKRAQAEEMRRKTFLPYRQGLLGCLGFSSKSCGAMDGFTRALNSVSSR